MRLTLEQKMKMCEEHVLKGKSISHASEMYGGYDIGSLKYLINIYKRYGKEAFLNRENGVYKRDTKLLAISIVENGESIRALVKYFENLFAEEIVGVNIPTGVPLVCELNAEMQVENKYYLGDQAAIKMKQEAVKNQSK